MSTSTVLPQASLPVPRRNLLASHPLTVFFVIAFAGTWIFNGAGQSILIASLTHAASNASQAWIGTLLPDQPAAVGYTALAIMALGALLVIVLTRGTLGYRQVPARVH